MQGIPTDRDLSFQSDVSSFTTDEDDSSLVNSRTAVIGQAGNAMHSEAVAIVWLFILTQSDKVQVQARLKPGPGPSTATATANSISIDLDSDSMDCSKDNSRDRGSSGVAKFFLNKRR